MFHYWKYRILSIFAASLPEKFLYWIAKIVADLFFYFNKKQRENVLSNVRIVCAFKASTRISSEHEEMIRQEAKTIFRNFAYYLVEFFRYDRYDAAWLEKYVTIEGQEYMDEAMARGKGVIIVSAHLGNWEIAGAATALLGYPLSVVYMKHRNEKLNELYVKQRSSKGIESVPLQTANRDGLDRLKKKRALALLCDIKLSGKGKSVPFFGRNVELPRGPEVLARRTGAAFIGIVLFREGRGRFTLRFFPLSYNNKGVNTPDNTSGKDVVAHFLESTIAANLSQWCVLWNVFT